jgi:hypothetical protein
VNKPINAKIDELDKQKSQQHITINKNTISSLEFEIKKLKAQRLEIYCTRIELLDTYIVGAKLHIDNLISNLRYSYEDLVVTQVIVPDQMQKLVILYNNDLSDINILTGAIKQEMLSTVTILDKKDKSSKEKSEVILNEVIGTRTENQHKYYEFSKSLCNMGLDHIDKNMEMSKLNIDNGMSWSLVSCQDDKRHQTIIYNQITNIDNTTNVYNVTGSTIIQGKNINANINSNNTTITAPNQTPQSVAKMWIANNPPEYRELISEYYERYKLANVKPLLINTMFGKLMAKSETHKQLSSNGKSYWILRGDEKCSTV